MEYLYSQVENANFHENTRLRKQFRRHLNLVAKALHDIEWVDSGDMKEHGEDKAIKAVIKKDELD